MDAQIDFPDGVVAGVQLPQGGIAGKVQFAEFVVEDEQPHQER